MPRNRRKVRNTTKKYEATENNSTIYDGSSSVTNKSETDLYNNDGFNEQPNEETDIDKINRTQNNIRQWVEYHRENIIAMRENKVFVYVTQWNDDEMTRLNLAKKPIMQSNKIYDVIIKIIGEYAQIGGELCVNSLNHDATEDEIKLNTDLLRTIYYNSDSQASYYQAFEDIVVGGFGAYGVGTQYESIDSINQIPCLYVIDEPEKCYFDLNAKTPTKADGEFCGRYISITKEAFKKIYPKINFPSSFPTNLEILGFSWGDSDCITICKEYRKEWYDFDLHLLSDGRMVRDEEWSKIEEENKRFDMSQYNHSANEITGSFPQHEMVSIEKTYKKRDCKIVLYEMISNQIINKQDFPGNMLPIVFCPGPSSMIDGKKRFLSLVKFARDPQRLHNYSMVEIAHSMQVSRKDKFLATVDNIANNREMWQNPSEVQGALIYSPDNLTKQAPIPLPASEIAQSLMAVYSLTEMAIENGIGFYEANKGKDTVEKSGVALKAQQMAGSLISSKAKSNMDNAIEQGGKIIMGMRKYIFDTERTLNLLDQNKKSRKVLINEQIADKVQNSLTKGDYKVIYQAGPTHQVQKEKQMEFMLKLAELTNSAPLAADLLAEMGDALPTFVERMRTLVPPDILAKEEGKPPPPPQPNPQAEMMKMQFQLKEKELQLENQKLQLELQKTQVQMEKIKADIEIAERKADAEIRKAALEHNSSLVDATSKMVSSHNDVKKEIHRNLSRGHAHAR